MGRKKEDRQTKADHKKARRLAKEAAESGEDDAVSLAHQLAPLGLQIREIPGDGNCLFRAVSDQLEGHSRNHPYYRTRTADFMALHRDDYEPFVEDDVPFDRHLALLRKSGTFAGNDALVALARWLEVVIVIHQAAQPVWQINPLDNDGKNLRQIHLSYHNGEHYNSIRRVGDHSHNPSSIQCGNTVSGKRNKMETKGRGTEETPNCNGSEPEVSDVVASTFDTDHSGPSDLDSMIAEVTGLTGICDRGRVERLLAENEFDVAAVVQLFAFGLIGEESNEDVKDESSGSADVESSPSDCPSKSSSDSSKKSNASPKPVVHVRPKMSRPELARSKVKSTKQKRKEKREEKKTKQAERNRRKLLGDEVDGDVDDDVHVLEQEIKCLEL